MLKRARIQKERLRARSLRFPSSTWKRLEEMVPAGERSRFIRDAVDRALSDREDADPSPKPAWQRLLDIADAIPPDEVENWPADASVNVDHYLYGAPERET